MTWFKKKIYLIIIFASTPPSPILQRLLKKKKSFVRVLACLCQVNAASLCKTTSTLKKLKSRVCKLVGVSFWNKLVSPQNERDNRGVNESILWLESKTCRSWVHATGVWSWSDLSSVLARQNDSTNNNNIHPMTHVTAQVLGVECVDCQSLPLQHSSSSSS